MRPQAPTTDFLLLLQIMETEMVLISKPVVQQMLVQLYRAEGYCNNAVSSSLTSWQDEPTASYPGASGYAGATMRDVIQTLESAI